MNSQKRIRNGSYVFISSQNLLSDFPDGFVSIHRWISDGQRLFRLYLKELMTVIRRFSFNPGSLCRGVKEFFIISGELLHTPCLLSNAKKPSERGSWKFSDL